MFQDIPFQLMEDIHHIAASLVSMLYGAIQIARH